MIYTATPVRSTATECFFRIKNYGDLPTWKQIKLDKILHEHFALVPLPGEGMLVLHIIFGLPVHAGMYLRRLEMLMFQLRCTIDPQLAFSTELVYTAS